MSTTFCTDQITLLAGEIYTGIGSPTAQSVGYVSGWITSSGALGQINNKLSTDFYLSGVGPCIAGGFGPEEAAIYSLMYESTYYFTQARSTLAGAGSFWLSVGDGDGRLTRTSSVEVSKEWRGLAKDTEQSLNLAICNWKLNHSLAVDVRAEQLASWPTP